MAFAMALLCAIRPSSGHRACTNGHLTAKYIERLCCEMCDLSKNQAGGAKPPPIRLRYDFDYERNLDLAEAKTQASTNWASPFKMQLTGRT